MEWKNNDVVGVRGRDAQAGLQTKEEQKYIVFTQQHEHEWIF